MKQVHLIGASCLCVWLDLLNTKLAHEDCDRQTDKFINALL